jgi:hypothetical protein
MKLVRMADKNVRIIDPDHPPRDAEIAAWIGKGAFKYWKKVMQLIEERYPGVFVPEWLFGGKKHGWSLRYKKNKSFCTLIPEKNRFALLIVFGAEERERVETIRKSLLPSTQKEYDRATTYHDGKWLRLAIDTDRVVEDILRLLAMKRKTKKMAEAPYGNKEMN